MFMFGECIWPHMQVWVCTRGCDVYSGLQAALTRATELWRRTKEGENVLTCTQKLFWSLRSEWVANSKVPFRKFWSHLELMKFRIPEMSPWEFWGNPKIIHSNSSGMGLLWQERLWSCDNLFGWSDPSLSVMGVVTGTQEITELPESLQGSQISPTQIRRSRKEFLRKLQTRTLLSIHILKRSLRIRSCLGRGYCQNFQKIWWEAA